MIFHLFIYFNIMVPLLEKVGLVLFILLFIFVGLYWEYLCLTSASFASSVHVLLLVFELQRKPAQLYSMVQILPEWSTPAFGFHFYLCEAPLRPVNVLLFSALYDLWRVLLSLFPPSLAVSTGSPVWHLLPPDVGTRGRQPQPAVYIHLRSASLAAACHLAQRR